jgi:hypothetical protein
MAVASPHTTGDEHVADSHAWDEQQHERPRDSRLNSGAAAHQKNADDVQQHITGSSRSRV